MVLVWVILLFSVGGVIVVFDFLVEGVEVYCVFGYVGLVSFIFLGGLFVFVLVFNFLGKFICVMFMMWLRDGVFMLLVVWWMVSFVGVIGVVYV